MKKYILASKSPRRKEILSLCNIDFDIIVSDADETMNPDNDLKDEIQKLAMKKAKAVFDTHTDSIVIGADTIVVFNNKILGKPKDEQDAFNMLKMLQGNTHEVITGVCFMSKEKTSTLANVSLVHFDTMSDEEILEYIATKDPLDKAGSYGIQGLASKYIKGIEGDFFSIMGLPLHDVYTLLKQY